MKISQYINEYTDKSKITFKDFLEEVKELFVEILKFNWPGIKEEFGDVFHFLQLWLHWRFGLDGQPWKISQHSVNKFMARKEVWNKIYQMVGLEKNISGYVGNYNKVEKVIKHLSNFGIDEQTAKSVYKKIVN